METALSGAASRFVVGVAGAAITSMRIRRSAFSTSACTATVGKTSVAGSRILPVIRSRCSRPGRLRDQSDGNDPAIQGLAGSDRLRVARAVVRGGAEAD